MRFPKPKEESQIKTRIDYKVPVKKKCKFLQQKVAYFTFPTKQNNKYAVVLRYNIFYYISLIYESFPFIFIPPCKYKIS